MSKEVAKKKIVVLGGGFAGLNFIKNIDHKLYDVTLVDKHNYHTFPPLFYQVASSGLDSTSISFPFRREFRKARARGTHLIMSQVTKVDHTKKEIITPWATIRYDILVISLGTTNNFFGQPDLIKSVYTLKSAAQAIRTRNDILDHLERAVATHDRELRRKLMSFVVIGGGPAGVEIAGALGEMKRYIIPREYPDLNPDDVNITLLEGTPRLLGTMSENASEKAYRYLNELLVNVRLGTLMKSYENDNITLSDGSSMEAGLVIWTAGVTGTPFPIITDNGSELSRTRGNRIAVDATHAVEGLDDVYAIGDIALMTADTTYPNGHPQLAQVAIQSATNLASNLNRGASQPFAYYDKGTMATIGRNRAVVDLKHIKFDGFIAWLTWMFIHLITLLGMRNKVSVLINWLWAYFSYSTSLRLIMHPNKFPLRSRWGER